MKKYLFAIAVVVLGGIIPTLTFADVSKTLTLKEKNMSLFSKLDPQIQNFLNQLEALHLPPANEIPVPVSREGYETMSRLHGGIPESMARTEDRYIKGVDSNDIKLRIYWPTLDSKLPLLMYTHGGGWSRGSIDTHDALCRKLAKTMNCIIVSVGYRLAPEYRFPAGYNDVLTAYDWCRSNVESLGGDGSRIAVAGDSAGGNLTAALVSTLVENDKKLPDFQVLIYPVMDCAFETKSVDTYNGYFLSRVGLESYREIYVPKENPDLKDFRLSPTYYNRLEKICPTIVVSAGADPLVDEGKLYVEKLQKAGVKVSYLVVEDVIHAYMHMFHLVPQQTKKSLDFIKAESDKYWKK